MIANLPGRAARLAFVLVFVCTFCRFVAGQEAAAEAKVKAIATLIESDRADGTINGRNAIMEGGPENVPILEALLKARPERGIERVAAALLMALAGPRNGIVCRTAGGGEVPEGIQDGDIVTKIWEYDIKHLGSLPDRVFDDFIANSWDYRHVRNPEKMEIEFWRPLHGEMTVMAKLAHVDEFPFFNYTDDVQQYYLKAKLGRWDAAVEKGLCAAARRCLDVATRSLISAYRDGCRNAYVFSILLSALRHSGRRDQALQMIERFADGLDLDPPTGRAKLGLIPVHHALALRRSGKLDAALKVLSNAIAVATQKKATGALTELLGCRLRFYVNMPIAKTLDYCRNDVNALRQHIAEEYWVINQSAGHLAAGGHPSLAVEWLRALENERLNGMIKHYSAQQDLAEKYRKELEPRSWIPVCHVSRTISGSTGFSRWFRHERMKGVRIVGPFRIDLKMRIRVMSNCRIRDGRSAGICIHGNSPWRIEIDEWGRVRTGFRSTGNMMERALLTNIDDWRDFSLRVTPHTAQVYCSGIPIASRFYSETLDSRFAEDPFAAGGLLDDWAEVVGDGKKSLPFAPNLVGAGAIPKLCDLTVFTPTSAKIDQDDALRALISLQNAVRECDLKQIEACHEKWTELVAPATDAAVALAPISKMVADMKRSASATGISLTTPDFFKKSRRWFGTWRLEGDWFSVIEKKPKGYYMGTAILFPMPLNNSELFGVLDLPRDKPKGQVRIHWNSSWSKGDSFLSLNPATGAVACGIWQGRSKKATIGELSGLVPFCIRVRGKEVAVFIRDGRKPVLTVDEVSSDRPNLAINFRGFGNTKMRIGHLHVRAVDKKAPLNAPVEPVSMPVGHEEGAWRYGDKKIEKAPPPSL